VEFNLFGGRRSSFEITIGTEEVFSKLATGQWPVAADIIAIVQDRLNGKGTESKATTKAESAKAGACGDGSCSTGCCSDKSTKTGSCSSGSCGDKSAAKCDSNTTTFKAGEGSAKSGTSTTMSMMLISLALIALAGGYFVARV
jgi:hypothetical protein